MVGVACGRRLSRRLASARCGGPIDPAEVLVQVEPDAYEISVAAKDDGAHRRLLLVADENLIAGLGIKRRVSGAGAVRDPALNDKVAVDGVRVVPQVIGGTFSHEIRLPAGR